MTPDVLNGIFELVGSLFILLNVKRVLRDKRVLGFDWRVMLFFTSWGFWNLYYYPHLDQWFSFVGGVSRAAVRSRRVHGNAHESERGTREGYIMSEASAWATLRKEFKRAGCHIQRFEDKLAMGIPDANICYDGNEAWLEGKFLKAWPKRASTKIKVTLSPQQVNWLTDRTRHGGTVFVWMRAPDGWWLFTHNFKELSKGVLREELYASGREFKTARDLVTRLLTDNWWI
jgi:hypothetical protein